MMDHEHDWGGNGKDALAFEDGAAIVREQCRWVEITDSFESEKHDEVFYEEGDECGETRTTRYEPVKVTLDNYITHLEIREQDFEIFDHLVQRAIESVETSENLKVLDIEMPDSPTPVVEVETGEFTVTYEP